MESLLSNALHGQPVIQEAGLSLENTTCGYVLTDGVLTDWITLYLHRPQWTCGRIFQCPQSIQIMLDKLAFDYFNLNTRGIKS